MKIVMNEVEVLFMIVLFINVTTRRWWWWWRQRSMCADVKTKLISNFDWRFIQNEHFIWKLINEFTIKWNQANVDENRKLIERDLILILWIKRLRWMTTDWFEICIKKSFSCLRFWYFYSALDNEVWLREISAEKGMRVSSWEYISSPIELIQIDYLFYE